VKEKVRLPDFTFKREAYLIAAISFLPVFIGLIAAFYLLFRNE
jgi:hypothetical protein